MARGGLVVIRKALELKDATFLPAGWSAKVTRVVFRILAKGLGVTPGEFAARVAAELDNEAAEAEGRLGEAEAREAQLVAVLTAERERTGAASVLSAGPSLETVIRMEAHLTRQLDLTLRQLERLQAGRGRAAGGVAAVVAGMIGLAGEPGAGAQRKNGFVPQSGPAGLDTER
ncbi:MAG TPA: hypothetical protein VKE74_31870 [Gemmataceae bacterium]|nr:hypothetical protein [Gemmataceae bacterium]